ncbi:MAG: DUF3298 and DUF4163 domain-containing protein [Bacteroidaceae bacterium]|nr:DUF3298 and DUF4163 domain-containing protein [Bacteroidaceae bacterium]
MKHAIRTIGRLISCLTITALVFTVTACKDKAGNTTYKHLERAWGEKQDSVKLSIDFPDYTDKRVNEAIAEQMSEAIGGTYEGSYADPDSLITHYTTNFRKEIEAIRQELAEYDMPSDWAYTQDLLIKKGYETDRLVTFTFREYNYSGGAHGSNKAYGMTFRKSDGRRMGTDVLNQTVNDEGWIEMRINGLMKYFDVKNEKDLTACLLGLEVYEIPAPSAQPYFTEEGLTFIYQQYEIAPYAAGMPSYTIPYDQLESYLNVTGRRLLAE